MIRLRGVFVGVATALLAVSGALIIASNSLAAESAALSISPKKNYTIEPGKSINDTLTIRNLDKEETLNLSLRVIDFTYTDQSGTPKLMTDDDAPQTTWSLKPFLTVPKTVSVAPNSSQTVDISVSVPKEQGAGSFYSAIAYSSGGSDGGNVALSATGVTLVFVTIPGQVKEDLTLKKVGAYDAARSKTAGQGFFHFTTELPKTIGYTLDNKGNVTESPAGSITLKPLLGKEITIQDINPNASLALIGQTRTFTTCIQLKGQEVNFQGTRAESTACDSPKDMWPGFYSVSLSAFYGQNGNRTQELAGSGWFWYLPWWFIIASIVALAFVGYHVWRFVNYIRSRRGTPRLKKKSNKK